MRVDLCNIVLKGDGKDVIDIPAHSWEHGGHQCLSTYWRISGQELRRLHSAAAEGQAIFVRLDVWSSQHPPVWVGLGECKVHYGEAK